MNLYFSQRKTIKAIAFILCLSLVLGMFGTTTLSYALSSDQIAANNALLGASGAVAYYIDHEDKTLTNWEELLAIYAVSKLEGSNININDWILPISPTPVPNQIKSYAPYIITELIKGYDPSGQVNTLISKATDGAIFSSDPIHQAMAMLAIDIASQSVVNVSAYSGTQAAAHLLSLQQADGGFYSTEVRESRSSNDTTGYVSLALAPYATNPAYYTSISAIVSYLEQDQLNNGGFNSYWGQDGSESPNSTALAVWGASALKTNLPDGSASKTSAASVISHALPALTRYQNTSGTLAGSFFHPASEYGGGPGTFNRLVGEQAMIALYDIASDTSIFGQITRSDSHIRTASLQIQTTTGAIITSASITTSSSGAVTALDVINHALSKEDKTGVVISENVIISVDGHSKASDESWKLFINGIAQPVTYVINDNDQVVLFLSKDTDRIYTTQFNQTDIVANMGSDVTLVLTGKELGVPNSSYTPIPGATILANGIPLGQTDQSGNVVLNFLESGTYQITAELNKATTISGLYTDTTITHPLSTLSVSSTQPYSRTVDIRIEGISQSGIISTPSALQRNFVVSNSGVKLLTVEDALQQLLEYKSMSASMDSSGYLTGINGLMKVDGSNWRSWMYMVNGETPWITMGNYVLQGNEQIVFYYINSNTLYPKVVLEQQSNEDLQVTVTADTWAVTDVPVSGASIVWDGIALGTTNELGIYNIPSVSATVGYHRLQLAKHDANGIPLVVPLASDYTVKISEKNTLDGSNATLNLSTKPSTSPQEITISSGAINPTIVVTTNSSIALPEIMIANPTNTISLLIPKDTHVSSSGLWDGSIQLPEIESISLSGKTITKAVSVGSSSNSLTFDQPVRLLIPGVAGKTIAYVNANGETINISEIITSDNASAASDSLTAAGKTDGFITIGNDVVIWTKHFTTFLAYTNSGGGAPVSNTITVSVTGYQGQTMLATQSLNFTSGMTALSALINTGLNVKIKTGSGYVEAINNLSEFDHGVESGWKYTVNGNYPSISANNYLLQTGDVVRWVYVTKINEGESLLTQPVVTRALTTIEAKADTAGNVNASIKNEELNNALKDGSSLQIESEVASIKFDQAALSKISGQISGDLTVTMTKADSSKLSEADKLLVGSRPVYEFAVKSGSTTISEFGGKVNVSMGYTLAAGEDPNAILIYYITKDGKLELVKNSRYNETTKRVEFTTDHFSAYAVGYHPVAFQDTKTHWAKDSINFLAARGILKGMTSDTFLPGKTVSRAEFVSILANKAGLDLAKYQSTGQGFADVKASDWFAKAVAWASDQGVVNGSQIKDGSMKFDPNANITRQDMAVILSRYLTKVEKTTLATPNAAVTFADQGKIASYASFAVKNMQQAGIINGKTTTTFAPVDSATRAEAGKMIAELMKVTF